MHVIHKRGPLLEETAYYPFGLTMAGISSKDLGGIENKKKYNGYELNSDFDINLYESFYRSHDPQLGRFWQIDPKPTDFESPFAAMGNNPIVHNDLFGDTPQNNIQVTAALTWSSAALDFKVKGTPVTVGATFRNDEKDIIGVRDNHFVFMGTDVYNEKRVTYRTGGGANVLGFGKEVVVESSRPAGTQQGTHLKKQLKNSTTTPISSTETTTDEQGKKSTQSSFSLSIKAALIVGFEIEIKVPIPDAIPGPPPPPTYQDNTRLQPIIFPIKKKS